MSRNFSLFPIRKLQRCPRYIPHDVAQSIRRLEVCRLHERVDVNDFKHTFLMGRANAVASFRDGPSVFGNHFDSPFDISFVRCFPQLELSFPLFILGTFIASTRSWKPSRSVTS